MRRRRCACGTILSSYNVGDECWPCEERARLKWIKAFEASGDGEVSAKQVERWMAGANAPNSENLSKLADAFDVTTDYLLGRTDWDGVDRRGRPVWTEAEREARKPEGPKEVEAILADGRDDPGPLFTALADLRDLPAVRRAAEVDAMVGLVAS